MPSALRTVERPPSQPIRYEPAILRVPVGGLDLDLDAVADCVSARHARGELDLGVRKCFSRSIAMPASLCCSHCTANG